MMYIYLSLVAYSCIRLIESANSVEKPLIFNPYTFEIYDLGETSMTYKNGPYAAACPAIDNQEDIFNQQYSFDQKSLFIRHYSFELDDSIHRIRCHNKVELAVAYYTHPRTYRKYLKFGYEIYFNLKRNPDDFKISSYFDFERVIKPPRKERIDHYFFGSQKSKTPVLLTDTDVGTSILAQMGFMWISKGTMQFDKSNWRADNLAYSITKKVDWPATKCDDYKLPHETLQEWPLDSYYSPGNQKGIFNSVQLLEDDCENKTDCVTKYSLLPAYQLQTIDSKSASCTNLATIPVWSKTTAPLLDYLDKFLFAIAQVADKKLRIYPELYDTLQLPISNKNGSKFKKMYLFSNPWKKKLAIPKIIFKIVVYQTHNCDMAKTLCWFHVLIVIHNEPTVSQKLCQDDICAKLGFESIQYQNKGNIREKSQHIYCCEMNEKLKKILMGSQRKNFKYENLDLKNFPKYIEKIPKFEYEDKLKLIEDKMKQWLGADGSSKSQKGWYPLPPSGNKKIIVL